MRFFRGRATGFFGRSVGAAVVFGTALISVSASATLPVQSWNGYHWARTGPLAIELGDNVSAAWEPFVKAAATQWSAATNIDFIKDAGRTSAAACAPVYGGVQVCSGNYGATGWLGYATVWLASGFIVEATVKLNDFYFTGKYDTPAWRAMTACQEIGHTLGLTHNDTVRTDLNKGTCMDYTNDPTGTAGGANGKLANLAPNASDFKALDGIYARVDTTQLIYTKPSRWAADGLDLGDFDTAASGGVPEPSSWALLIAGFGLAGAMLRRGRVSRSAAPGRPASVPAI